MSEMEFLKFSQDEFLALPEYSRSYPTGTTIGKRWRREHCWIEEGVEKKRWLIGEYVEHPDPKKIGMRWYRVLILKGDMYV